MPEPAPDGGRARALVVGIRLLFVALALVALVLARDVLLVGFFAVLVAAVLTYPIDLLARIMPRGAAVLVTLLGFGLVVAGVLWLVVPFVAAQVQQLIARLPEALARIERVWVREVRPALESGGAPASPQHALPAIAGAASGLAQLASASVEVLAGAVVIVALAFFLAHEPDGYRRALRAFVPRDREAIYDEAWRRVGTALRHWMGAILISMSIMGTLTAIGLRIAGVDGWATLALLTFLGTFVPYAGALASAVPGLAVALADSPRRFAWALLVYLGVHLVEGYLVEPLVMKRAVRLRPALLLFWQLLMGAIFGVLGVIVATPLLACAQVAADYLYVERTLGKAPAA